MTDEEILDVIGVPDDKRQQLLAYLHAWARSYVPGPGMYAVKAVHIWQEMQRAEPLWPMT